VKGGSCQRGEAVEREGPREQKKRSTPSGKGNISDDDRKKGKSNRGERLKKVSKRKNEKKSHSSRRERMVSLLAERRCMGER